MAHNEGSGRDNYLPDGGGAKVPLMLVEQIANSLADDIIRGVYAPGQPLIEMTIAEAFNVSRGPVREAFQQLQVEGLVDVQPRRGARVAVLTPQTMKESFDVRAVLYGLIAAEAASRNDAATLKVLHERTDALKASVLEDTDTFFALMFRLNVQFVEAGQNQYARKFLMSLRRLTLPITRKVMRDEGNRASWIANWEAVLAAIERGDSQKADEAARRWIMAVYDKDREIAEDEPPGSPYSATAGANQTVRQMKPAAGTSIKRG
jgi:DNA-binding GntR family transcriptional regulator